MRQRIPVYLSAQTFRDKSGTPITIRERRLVKLSESDRVIAIVEAPPGTRIRQRRDQHGPEQLIVPLSNSFWGRLFHPRVVIPAKYVIGKARSQECGLSLLNLDEPADESPLPE